MPAVLLKHHLLSAKNRFLARTRYNRPIGITILSILMMYGIYVVLHSFLRKVSNDADFGPLLSQRFLSLSLAALLTLLLVSNFISALANLFSGKDLELLLTLPISSVRLFLARLCETVFNSSWMFLFFALPAVLAYRRALDLPWTFVLTAFAVTVPLLLIPAAIGVAGVVIFVNIIPAHRMKDLLAVSACICVAFFLIFGSTMSPHVTQDDAKLRDLVYAVVVMEDTAPAWSPATWATDVLSSYLPQEPAAGSLPVLLLISTALGTLAFAYLLFDLLFLRGWNLSLHSSPGHKFHGTLIGTKLSRQLLPLAPHFRALLYKEARTFVRDSTQSLQLLFLLMLTFVYLYNFRALQSIASLQPNVQHWWDLVLCISNIALGTCIVAAISTRFVFPTVSLEGRGYSILRSAPVSIHGLLWNKFLIWIFPISAVSATLLVSGAWAIGVSPHTVALCAVLSLALSIGIVGTGIGVGAVFAKFDWDTPTEIAASFGSLVFMLLSLVVLFITLIPASLLIACSSVPAITRHSGSSDFMIVYGAGLFLVFLINIVAAKRAINVGAQSLLERER